MVARKPSASGVAVWALALAFVPVHESYRHPSVPAARSCLARVSPGCGSPFASSLLAVRLVAARSSPGRGSPFAGWLPGRCSLGEHSSGYRASREASTAILLAQRATWRTGTAATAILLAGRAAWRWNRCSARWESRTGRDATGNRQTARRANSRRAGRTAGGPETADQPGAERRTGGPVMPPVRAAPALETATWAAAR
jgi:hypothetical protein